MLGTIVSWIIIGIIAGVVVALVFPNTKRYLVGTISFGIIGSIIGGILYSAIQIGEIVYSVNPASLLLTVLFAVIFIISLRVVTKSKS